MPPTEQTQYTMVCKDKFESLIENDKAIFSKVDEIHKVIVGNGEDGITGRLIRVEGEQEAIKNRWKWIFGILAVVVAAMIVSYLKG